MSRLMYRKYFKRALSLLLLCALLPLVLLLPPIALAVRLNLKSGAIYRQQRVGKNSKPFMLYKFRTMRADAPGDTPTHMLTGAHLYTSRFTRFLRRSSLDELPQLLNILRGEMCFVGPRPALWNQDDLTGLRAQNGSLTLTPGLTGWAQINGRDEISVAEKARLDGEYAKNLTFLFDVKILFLTALAVIRAKDVMH